MDLITPRRSSVIPTGQRRDVGNSAHCSLERVPACVEIAGKQRLSFPFNVPRLKPLWQDFAMAPDKAESPDFVGCSLIEIMAESQLKSAGTALLPVFILGGRRLLLGGRIPSER